MRKPPGQENFCKFALHPVENLIPADYVIRTAQEDKMTQKMTMKQIAELAGCSISQVSRVLNEKVSVATEVRDRIRKIAQEHHFRINITSHHVRLCLLKNSDFGYFIGHLHAGLEKACEKRGWLLYNVNHFYTPGELGEQFFDGYFCFYAGKDFQQEWMKYQQIPLVMLNSYGLHGGEICSVEPDPYDNSLKVLRHLKSLGHRKIAKMNYSSGVSSMRGYNEFMRAAKELKLTEAVDIHGKPFSPERFLEDVKKLVSSGVTALFIIHQKLAFQAVQLLKSQGYRIPQDFSVVTYELDHVSKFCDPPVTTLDFDFDEIGEKACEIMAMRLQGIPCPAKEIRVQSLPLKIRKSTGPVPKR